MERKKSSENGCCGCIFIMSYMVVFFLAGGWAVNYLISFAGKTMIPFAAAGVVGMITGPIVVTIALVVAILHAFHVI